MPDPKGEWSLKENNSELQYRNIQKLMSSSTPWSVTICQISGSYPKQFFRYFFTRLFLYKMPVSEKGEKANQKFLEYVQKLISSSTPWSVTICQIS